MPAYFRRRPRIKLTGLTAFIAAVSATATLGVGAAAAAPGDLDTTFDGDGLQLNGFLNDGLADAGFATAIQADGKIVVAGSSDQGPGKGGGQFALARYNRNGGLNQSFTGDGTQLTGFKNGALEDSARAVAIQADGKIVAAGYSQQGPRKGGYQFALARYKKDGTLDKSFAGDGRQLTGFGNGDDFGFDLAIQTDGKIVAAGFSNHGPGTGGQQFALARYKKDGTLDKSFAGDGRKLTGFVNGDLSDAAEAVAIQADGKIVVAGLSDQGPGKGGQQFALARYNQNGALDKSFAGDGRKLTGFGNADLDDDAHALAVQGNGRIVVVGRSDRGDGNGGGQFALARYNGNGKLDKAFDGDGRQLTGFDNADLNDNPNAVAVQGDGKIVVFGDSDQGPGKGNQQFALARYNPNGSLNKAFDGDGRQLTGFGNGDLGEFGNAVAIQGDGKIVAVGTSQQESRSTQFALARYLP